MFAKTLEFNVSNKQHKLGILFFLYSFLQKKKFFIGNFIVIDVNSVFLIMTIIRSDFFSLNIYFYRLKQYFFIALICIEAMFCYVFLVLKAI